VSEVWNALPASVVTEAKEIQSTWLAPTSPT